jgi:hypothetical protein
VGKTWKFGILQLYQYQCASDMEKEWETKKREEDAGLDAIRKCLLL